MVPLVDIQGKNGFKIFPVKSDKVVDVKEEQSIIDVQKCGLCETWIIGQEQIKQHIKSCGIQMETSFLKTENPKCQKCGHQFMNVHALYMHNKHGDCRQRTCARCGKTFT